ncbi:ER protein Pkr1-domain-containing protein [Kalaharituber pfeilii]|nr:ER protein Pkr1-domain-containing protein [Kalaharituber pfeilii]
MPSFFEELWASIFIPGTTPALLIATNVSFFLLQVTLIILLFAAYSIHFVIMNIICGGLWAGINWFAKEVEEFKQLEEAKKLRSGNDKGGSSTGAVDTLEDKKGI